MTAAASNANGWQLQGPNTQLAPGAQFKLTANAQVGYGQCCYFSDSLGTVALNDGTVPGLVSAGVCVQRGGAGPNALEGVECLDVHQGVGGKQAASTIANDGFTALDFLAVAYDAGNGVPGKLSNYLGANRSIMGLVFGVDRDLAPYVWAGPVASLCARSLLLLNNFSLASHGIADAAANTATAERIVSNRPKVKGTVTGVSYVGSALVVGDTDYVTATISKRDGAGGGAVTIATYDSRAAGNGAAAAFVPKAWTLSVVAGALNLLETDEVTIAIVKGGAGQVLTGRINITGKAI